MKIYISADIEGVNGITHWDETNSNHPDYRYFQKQMIEEVKNACLGAKEAGAKDIFIKDAHDSARNLILTELPEFVRLHRGWEGSPCSMMAGLDKTFDAVIFIGYHSPSRSDGNSLSHTMNTRIHHLKINGVIASEFTINALYASYLGVPIAFLSGDKNLTIQVKEMNKEITTVITKEGAHGATISSHPNITNKLIKEQVCSSLKKDLSLNKIEVPKNFNIEIQYKKHTDAYSSSFYPGCQLSGSDRVIYQSNNYFDVLTMFKFIL